MKQWTGIKKKGVTKDNAKNKFFNSMYRNTTRGSTQKIFNYLSIFTKAKIFRKISVEENISIRTLRYWIQKYQELGLRGLVRMKRTDKSKVKVDLAIQDQVKKYSCPTKVFQLLPFTEEH